MENTTWKLDPAHSELRFKIRHLMIANVSGAFKNFDVQMQTSGEDLSTAIITMTADTTTISTGNEQRDAHLLNADFFDAGHHPGLEFKSVRVRKKDEENFLVDGKLTIKGITKPVTLHVEYSGVAKDPWGGERAGFVVSAKINRSDWDMTFNSVLETGGLALSDEVKIAAELQMVRIPEEVLA